MNPIELGKFIAKLRQDKKLTQDDLANMLYIDKRKVSRWECGTSTPEFDMLIKLSEILDVSLYELSICKKLDKEKLGTKVINKFKSIKDLKRYNLKKIIKITLVTILVIFSIFTAIFTFKNYGTVEIYELKSLDENYDINGRFITIKNNILININNISQNNNFLKVNKNCVYSIDDNNKKRLFHLSNNDTNTLNDDLNFFKYIKNKKFEKSILLFHISCPDNDNSFNFKLNKIYDNKLF